MASVFYRLSNELLGLIVEYVVASDDESPRDSYTGETLCVEPLRRLRRVHPHFARLDALNERLFTCIQLIVDGDFLDGLEHAHYDTVGPYVRFITFKMSEYDRELELEEFKEVVKDNCPEHLTLNDEEIGEAWVNWGGYNSSYLASWSRRAFAAFLRSVRKDQQIEIGQCKTHLPPQTTPGGIAKQARLDGKCGHLPIQRLGDYLFDIALRSLADAAIQPIGIYLGNHTTSPCRMMWMADGIPEWDSLDLSKLTSLRYEPRMYSSYSYDEWQLEDPQRQGGMGLDLVLQKCSRSLKRLQVSSDYTPIRWPTRRTPALPSLIDLLLEHVAVEVPSLTKIIQTSPELEYLLIDSNSEREVPGPTDFFKGLFDAIREHKKNLEFRVHSLPVNEFYFFTCHVRTAKPQHFDGRNVYDEQQAYKAGEAYLTGTVGWIRPLRCLYEGKLEDSEDEKDD